MWGVYECCCRWPHLNGLVRLAALVTYSATSLLTWQDKTLDSLYRVFDRSVPTLVTYAQRELAILFTALPQHQSLHKNRIRYLFIVTHLGVAGMSHDRLLTRHIPTNPHVHACSMLCDSYGSLIFDHFICNNIALLCNNHSLKKHTHNKLFMTVQGALELGPLRRPKVATTLTKRRLYCILLLARPVFFFFFSCASTCK